MSEPDDPGDEASRRERLVALDRALKGALERREAEDERARVREANAESARRGGSAWRMVSNLVAATVVVSLAGYAADQALGSSPFGLLAGLFLGFGVGMWMAARAAAGMQAQTREEQRKPPAPGATDGSDGL